MPKVSREVAKHSLNVWPDTKPFKQHLWCFVKDRCRAIGEEIAKIFLADFIKEVYHPDWLANLVLVPKKE